MLKFNKVHTLKIISLIVCIAVFCANTAYSIDLSNKNHLRKPLDFNQGGSDRYKRAIDVYSSGNQSLTNEAKSVATEKTTHIAPRTDRAPRRPGSSNLATRFNSFVVGFTLFSIVVFTPLSMAQAEVRIQKVQTIEEIKTDMLVGFARSISRFFSLFEFQTTKKKSIRKSAEHREISKLERIALDDRNPERAKQALSDIEAIIEQDGLSEEIYLEGVNAIGRIEEARGGTFCTGSTVRALASILSRDISSNKLCVRAVQVIKNILETEYFFAIYFVHVPAAEGLAKFLNRDNLNNEDYIIGLTCLRLIAANEPSAIVEHSTEMGDRDYRPERSEEELSDEIDEFVIPRADMQDIIRQRGMFQALESSIRMQRLTLEHLLAGYDNISTAGAEETRRKIRSLEDLRRQLLESSSEFDFASGFSVPYTEEQRFIVEGLSRYVPIDENMVFFVPRRSSFWTDVMGDPFGFGAGLKVSLLDRRGEERKVVFVRSDVELTDLIEVVVHEGNHIKRSVPMIPGMSRTLYTLFNEGFTQFMSAQDILGILGGNEEDLISVEQDFRRFVRKQFAEKMVMSRQDRNVVFTDVELAAVETWFIGNTGYTSYIKVVRNLIRSIGLSELSDIFEQRDTERFTQKLGHRLHIMNTYADLIYNNEILQGCLLGMASQGAEEVFSSYLKNDPLFKELLRVAADPNYSKERFKAVEGVYEAIIKYVEEIMWDEELGFSSYDANTIKDLKRIFLQNIPRWIEMYSEGSWINWYFGPRRKVKKEIREIIRGISPAQHNSIDMEIEREIVAAQSVFSDERRESRENEARPSVFTSAHPDTGEITFYFMEGGEIQSAIKASDILRTDL